MLQQESTRCLRKPEQSVGEFNERVRVVGGSEVLPPLGPREVVVLEEARE